MPEAATKTSAIDNAAIVRDDVLKALKRSGLKAKKVKSSRGLGLEVAAPYEDVLRAVESTDLKVWKDSAMWRRFFTVKPSPFPRGEPQHIMVVVAQSAGITTITVQNQYGQPHIASEDGPSASSVAERHAAGLILQPENNVVSAARVAARHLHADSMEWAGIDVRSFNQRRESWWMDMGKLIEEWWSWDKVTIRRTRGKLEARVHFPGSDRREVEITVKGPENRPTVYVWSAEKSFGPDDTIKDIMYWIDSITRP